MHDSVGREGSPHLTINLEPAPAGRTSAIKITALSTGTLQLKPTFLGFPASWPVTPDGSIVALPTPGHSPGHTSYLVRTAKGAVLLAGDVTYDRPALVNQRDQGFIADVDKHRETLRRMLSLVKGGVAYLPSHDPESAARL